MPSPSAEFHHAPKALRRSTLTALAFAVVFPLGGVLSGQAWVLWLTLVMGLGCLVLAAHCLRLGFDRRPLLRIGPEGLTYLWFSPAPTPWAEIARIAVVRTYALHVKWGKASHVYQPSLDQINFAVAHPESAPRDPSRALSRWVQSMDGRPPIAIQTCFVANASTEQLLTLIKQHWPGAIEEREVRPRAPD